METLRELRTSDPMEYGFRMAQAGGSPENFQTRYLADMPEDARELAIEGWNEFQDEQGVIIAERRIVQ